jgi:hypothetical protein
LFIMDLRLAIAICSLSSRFCIGVRFVSVSVILRCANRAILRSFCVELKVTVDSEDTWGREGGRVKGGGGGRSEGEGVPSIRACR